MFSFFLFLFFNQFPFSSLFLRDSLLMALIQWLSTKSLFSVGEISSKFCWLFIFVVDNLDLVLE